MTKVSKFTSAKDNVPTDYDLDKWLMMTIDPPKKLRKKVESYRKTGNIFSKAMLPCITVSARFKKIRNLENIKSKTGFICIDIDRDAKSKKQKCNLCADMTRVRELFSRIPFTYYAGLSTGGDGIYAIIKIDRRGELIKYFEVLKERLARIGLNIDNSCKDYTRLRFFSYDQNAYYNPDARAMKLKKKKKLKKKGSSSNYKADSEKVEAAVQLIEKHSIDITGSYDDWVKVGAALNNAFGEQGRTYFHRVSRFHPEYNRSKTDTKYTQCSKMKSINLSSFFYVADSYGIRY